MTDTHNLFITPLVDIDPAQMSDSPIALIPVRISNKTYTKDATALLTHCAFGTTKILKALDVKNHCLTFFNQGVLEHWLLFAVCSDSQNSHFCLLKLLGTTPPVQRKALQGE